eukprot:GFYU01005966.1.p1 GENE.GFYU01005966.1~~GFYU01005966.1.p1  ORF type:complete len:124 (+),score=5.75 GFYU01005966.1:421-792(+)
MYGHQQPPYKPPNLRMQSPSNPSTVFVHKQGDPACDAPGRTDCTLPLLEKSWSPTHHSPSRPRASQMSSARYLHLFPDDDDLRMCAYAGRTIYDKALWQWRWRPPQNLGVLKEQVKLLQHIAL